MHDRARYFATETWTGGVIGLGYVGLPLAVTMVRRGLPVLGFDVSAERIDRLGRGISPIEDVTDEELAEALASGLTLTADPGRLTGADALFLCVPSPLGRHREPDMSYIEAAAATVAAVVQPGMLIALESTTYPGTTRDLLVPAATSGGLELDGDVFVAFSPERVNPGADLKTGQIPKVVGGVTAVSTEVASAAYSRIVDSVFPVSSARVAEMAKLLENTYRAVNIALVNEMAQLAHHLDIDIWEVVDAAASKPFGFQAFYPGPGVGGHCIPLDPQFLAWRAREANVADPVHRPGGAGQQGHAQLYRRACCRPAQRATAPGGGYPHPRCGDRLQAQHRRRPRVGRRSTCSTCSQERGAEVSVLDPVVAPERISAHGFEVVDDTDDLLPLRAGGGAHRPRRPRPGGVGQVGPGGPRHPWRLSPSGHRRAPACVVAL